MAISYPRAPLVAPGDRITSTQFAGIANAFNARLRSGLGNPSERIFYYLWAMFRTIRNCDTTGLVCAPNAEFFEVYQMLEPESAEWPIADPGDPEGARLDNPMAAYLFGSASADLDSEDVRLADPDAGGVPLSLDGGVIPSKPSEYWELAKQQRGAFDPDAGVIGSPAFRAAREFYKLQTSLKSPMGNSYGGYLPLPEKTGDCADGTPDTPPTPDYKIFFTRLDPAAVAPADVTDTGSTIEYPGTCPDTVGDVLAVYDLPWAYYVFRVGGVVDILPAEQWIEGPYQFGAALRRAPGKHWGRIFNAFCREFRGSDAQRSDPKYHLQQAADNQKFFLTQYPLAPNIGTRMGDFIAAAYPTFTLDGDYPSGTAFGFAGGGTAHNWAEGTVLTGGVAIASGLDHAITIKIFDEDTVIKTVVLEPDENGDAETLLAFDNLRPGNLTVKLDSPLSGTARIELNELLEYKPRWWDWFLILRLSAGADSGPVDGRGTDETRSRTIMTDFLRNGCLVNANSIDFLPGQLAAINPNAVYDAARRLSQFVRVATRRNFIGYEVAGGKSILYFTRYAYGLSHDSPVDIFAGIAPGRLEVSAGAIQPDRRYIVRAVDPDSPDGNVSYAGANYGVGQTFTGLRGEASYSATDAKVYEYEGIYPVAPYASETNEWQMHLELKNFSNSDSSIWKPEAYGDYFAWANRCHFEGAEIQGKSDLAWHFNYGQKEAVAPEAVSGYNYASGLNGPPDVTPEFYRSCRIYEPDAEIESAVVLIEGLEEVVKLTFKTRFHHCSGAPSTIARDSSTWNLTDLDNEPFRSWENGLRDCIMHATTNRLPSVKIGDAAADSSVFLNPDDPKGAIIPHFFFTRLIPLPYADDNDHQDPHDTHILHDPFLQMELYLRAMCEGAVDTRTTLAYGCESGTYALLDYTFENLCFDAFGGRWIGTLDSRQRPDNPDGFGPVPNVETRAEIFNRLAKCINLLTKFRVPLPFKIECREINYRSQIEVRLNDAAGGDAGNCSTIAVTHGFFNGTPPAANELNLTSAWSDCAVLGPQQSAYIRDNLCALSGNWLLEQNRIDNEFRATLIDADALEAIPENWRDMISTDAGLIAISISNIPTTFQRLTTVLAESSECPTGTPGFWFDGSGSYWLFGLDNHPVTSCQFLKVGTLTAPQVGGNVFTAGRSAGGDNCFSAVSNTINITPIVQETLLVEIPLTG